MHAHKITDSAACDMWLLVNMLLPDQVTVPLWHKVRTLLARVKGKYCQRVECCPNDCIAYWDSTYLPESYHHAHRRSCPVCGTARTIVDPLDGVERARKSFFFFPLAPFLRSLFARPDLVPYLYADRGGQPEGAVTRSRGFKAKVLDNPVMNADHRNIALVGTCDGVPFFKDQRRGGWPFVLRVANLPDVLSEHMSNTHLHLIAANEHWELDEGANLLRRRIRAPTSMMPHLHVVTDDLLGAYKRGVYLSTRTM
jgi:hypothetical protein